MADNDLSEIEARVAATTPGTWTYLRPRHNEARWIVHNGDSSADVISTENEADAAFIAHAKQDIALLIEEVRVLRAYLNRLDLPSTEPPPGR